MAKKKTTVIYKTVKTKKEFNQILKEIKKAPKSQKYEIKYKQKDGSIKKFRYGSKRKEVINRSKTWVNSKGKERSYMRNRLSRLKKPVLAVFTFEILNTDGEREKRYIRKIHDPEIRKEESIEAFEDIYDDLNSSYDIEEITLIDVTFTRL